MKNNVVKETALFLIGGAVYQLIEILWKSLVSNSPIHWSMFLLGGLCFLIIGGLNNYLPWELSIAKQGLIGATAVTILEFIFGYILNIKLNLNIWDYSHLPLNIMGQICLPFFFIWIILSIIAIFLDDWLRWELFNDEYPHYYLFTKKEKARNS